MKITLIKRIFDISTNPNNPDKQFSKPVYSYFSDIVPRIGDTISCERIDGSIDSYVVLDVIHKVKINPNPNICAKPSISVCLEVKSHSEFDPCEIPDPGDKLKPITELEKYMK